VVGSGVVAGMVVAMVVVGSGVVAGMVVAMVVVGSGVVAGMVVAMVVVGSGVVAGMVVAMVVVGSGVVAGMVVGKSSQSQSSYTASFGTGSAAPGTRPEHGSCRSSPPTMSEPFTTQ